MKNTTSKPQLYTTPKISIAKNNKKGRSYISYHIDGVRYREYNGNRLGLKIYPNRCTNAEDKVRHLMKIQ